MHEINTAAETITGAADPDANIIFGATISPDIVDEIIITVVATGFDAAYFAKQAQKKTGLEGMDEPEAPLSSMQPASGSSTAKSQPRDADMRDIDMDLDAGKASNDDFTSSDATMPNIWSADPDDDDSKASSDTPVSKPSPVSSNDQDDDDEPVSPRPTILEDDGHKPFVSSMDDDELEKPSFLRRLAKRRRSDD